MKIKIEFEKPFFDDLQPEPKDANELIIQILNNSTGEINFLNKYNHREINQCARQLISGGYLRGTIIDYYSCVWSKATRRGRYLLELLENYNNSE